MQHLSKTSHIHQHIGHMYMPSVNRKNHKRFLVKFTIKNQNHICL